MRRFVLVVLLALLWLPTAACANPMVHRSGLQVVDGSGKPLYLRGVNLTGWYQWEGFVWGKGILTSYTTILAKLEKLLGQEGAAGFQQKVYDNFITEDDIAEISRLGFNSVRIMFSRRLLADDSNPDTLLPSGWAQLDRALGWCAKHHLYAILDLHAVPGGQSKISTADPGPESGLVWNSEASRQRTVNLWKAIAARYKDNAAVAGYDLINEPAPPDGKDLVQLYRRIIAAIRSVDKNHMVILEGGKLAMDFSMLDAPLDANEIYSFHMYTWFGDNRAKKLAEYEAVAQAQQVPFWIGEFGENSYDMIQSTVDMYEGAPFIAGWNYFPWKRAPTKYPGLLTIDVPEHWGKIINWISSTFAWKPKEADVEAGVPEFFEAVKPGNCHLDQKMLAALLGNPAR